MMDNQPRLHEEHRGIKTRVQELFYKQMHMNIFVHNLFSLQHNMELRINIVIQGVLHYLITKFVATETLVMGLSNNYSFQHDKELWHFDATLYFSQ